MNATDRRAAASCATSLWNKKVEPENPERRRATPATALKMSIRVEADCQLEPTLRAAAGYRVDTPLVVMPERVDPDMQGLDKNVIASDWICYYEDADQLQRLIVRLICKT